MSDAVVDKELTGRNVAGKKAAGTAKSGTAKSGSARTGAGKADPAKAGTAAAVSGQQEPREAQEPQEPDEFAVQIGDQIESFILSVREVAKGDDPDSAVPYLLLEVSQLLLAGGRLGAHEDMVPDERYEPDAGPEPDEDDLRQRLATLLEPIDVYSEVFDPYVPRSTPVACRISDDLADVVADLAHGLTHFRAGRVSEALWWWQFSYLSNWGSTASASLRALQSLVAHVRLDSPLDELDGLDTGTDDDRRGEAGQGGRPRDGGRARHDRAAARALRRTARPGPGCRARGPGPWVRAAREAERLRGALAGRPRRPGDHLLNLLVSPCDTSRAYRGLLVKLGRPHSPLSEERTWALSCRSTAAPPSPMPKASSGSPGESSTPRSPATRWWSWCPRWATRRMS